MLKLLLKIFCCVLLSFSSGFAQDQTLSNSSLPASSRPEVFELKDLVPNLENLNEYFVQFDLKLEQARQSTEISKELEDLNVEVFEQIKFYKRSQIFTFEQLSALEKPLLVNLERLSTFANNISKVIAELTLLSQDLDRKFDLWRNTDREISRDELPTFVRTNIKDAIKSLENKQKLLQNRLEYLISAQAGIASLTKVLNENLRNIDETRQDLRSGLFVKDGYAFFERNFWEKLFNEFSLAPIELLPPKSEVIYNYFSSSSKLITVHFTLGLFVALFLLLKRNTINSDPNLKSIFGSLPVFFVNSVLLLSYLIYRDAPNSVFDIIGVVLIVPISIFLRNLFGRQHFFLIIGFAVLYLSSRLHAVSDNYSALSQAIFFVELIWAGLLSLRLVHEVRQLRFDGQHTDSRFLKLICLVGKIFSLTFLLLAFIFALGLHKLTVFVGEGLLSAIFSGLQYFVTYKIVLAVFYSIVESNLFVGINFIRRHKMLLLFRAGQLLGLILALVWFKQLFTLLGLQDPFFEKINQILNASGSLNGYSISLKSIFIVILTYWVAVRFYRITKLFLEADIYPRRGWDQGVQHALNVGMQYSIAFLAISFALGSIGIDLKNLAIIAGALSVGIGFGLQAIVNNFVSGLILLVERPIKIGDFIMLGDTLGHVTRIGIRATTIRTQDDSEIIVPNSSLVSDKLINWSHSSSQARISSMVGVAYGSDPQQVMRLLIEAAKSIPERLEYPEPVALLKNFGDSSLNFEVYVWVAEVSLRAYALSNLNIAINQKLKENGVNIPFPQREVRVIARAG